MYWEVVVGKAHLGILWLPALLVPLGILVVLVGGVLAIFAGRRWPGSVPVWPFLLTPLLVTLAVVPVIYPLWAWYSAREAAYPPDHRVAQAFGGFLAAETGGTVLCGLLMTTLLGLAVARAPRGTEWLGYAALIASTFAGWLLSVAGAIHAGWLLDQGGFGDIGIDGPSQVHVGHERTVRPVVGDPTGAAWVPGPSATFSPAVPGVHTVGFTAWRGPLRVRQDIEVLAGEDRDDPAFPLHAGDTRTYQSTYESGAQLLLLFHSRDERLGPAVRLETGQPEERDGMRVFPMTWTTDQGTTETWMAYGFDGETRLYRNGHDELLHRAVSVSGEPAPGPGMHPCVTALFPGTCWCEDAGFDDTPAGPQLCVDHQGGTTAGGIGTAIAVIFTLGMVIPDNGHTVSWVERGAERGP